MGDAAWIPARDASHDAVIELKYNTALMFKRGRGTLEAVDPDVAR